MLKERKRVYGNYTEQKDSVEENAEVQLLLMSITEIDGQLHIIKILTSFLHRFELYVDRDQCTFSFSAKL